MRIKYKGNALKSVAVHYTQDNNFQLRAVIYNNQPNVYFIQTNDNDNPEIITSSLLVQLTSISEVMDYLKANKPKTISDEDISLFIHLVESKTMD